MQPQSKLVDAACHQEDLPSCFQSDIASIKEKLEDPWQRFPMPISSSSKAVGGKVLKCKECPSSFGSTQGLKLHLTKIHNTQTGSKAEQSNLSWFSALQNHMSLHLVNACEKCPYSTRSAHYLKNDLDATHTRKKPNILRNRRKTTTDTTIETVMHKGIPKYLVASETNQWSSRLWEVHIVSL